MAIFMVFNSQWKITHSCYTPVNARSFIGQNHQGHGPKRGVSKAPVQKKEFIDAEILFARQLGGNGRGFYGIKYGIWIHCYIHQPFNGIEYE